MNRRGSVSLEVALLFPLAVMVLVGFSEMYFYVRAAAIIERVAFSVADSVAKRVALTDCTLETDSSFLGTHMLMGEVTAQPLNLAQSGQVIVSAVVDNGGNPNVIWQRRSTYTLNKTSVLGKEGQQAILPKNVVVAAVAGTQPDTLVVVEVFYRFQPFSGIRTLLPTLPLDVTLTRQAYARARVGSLANLGAQNGCPRLPRP